MVEVHKLPIPALKGHGDPQMEPQQKGEEAWEEQPCGASSSSAAEEYTEQYYTCTGFLILETIDNRHDSEIIHRDPIDSLIP